MFENEELNIDAPEQEAHVEMEHEEEAEHSLVDKIYAGEVDYRSLDGATRKTVLNEVYNGLDDKKKRLWDNGWKDKPFFLGKDRNGNDVPWKDAETFERTLKIPQVKKERENHLIDELRKRDAEIEKLKNMTKMNLERNLEQDEASIESEIKRAREELDVDALEQALKKRDTLTLNKNKVKEYYDETPAPTRQPTEQEIISQMPIDEQQAYLGFKSRNMWFGIDQDLSQFAGTQWESIQYANIPMKEKLDFVEKRTRAAFPSKFPKTTTNYMPTTTTTNNNQVAKSDNKSVENIYSKLPDRDKTKITNLIVAGKFPNREAVLKSFGLI